MGLRAQGLACWTYRDKGRGFGNRILGMVYIRISRLRFCQDSAVISIQEPGSTVHMVDRFDKKNHTNPT